MVKAPSGMPLPAGKLAISQLGMLVSAGGVGRGLAWRLPGQRGSGLVEPALLQELLELGEGRGAGSDGRAGRVGGGGPLSRVTGSPTPSMNCALLVP